MSFLLNSYIFAETWAADPLSSSFTISAPFALVRNITTGQNIFAKAADTVCATNQAASLAKMMTAIILVKTLGSSLSNTTTCLAAEVDGSFNTPTFAGLAAGDVVSLEALLYGLLLPSGNDAAEVIARYTGDALGGVGGRVRFITEMNTLAATYGMTQTVFGSPHGINLTPDGSNNSVNTTTARDYSRLVYHCFYDPVVQAYSSTPNTLQEIGRTQNYTINITGGPRNGSTLPIISAIPLTDPEFGNIDSGLLAAKGGSATTGTDFSTAAIQTAPNGHVLSILVIGSTTKHGDRELDSRGLYWEALSQFPSLAGTDTDANFSNVKVLSGFESGFTDESTVGRTLTAVSATRSSVTPIIGSFSALTNGTTDYISMPNATDLHPGSSDFTIEIWFRGNGSVPAAFAAWFSKWDTTSNLREFSLQYDTAQAINFFVSTIGSDSPVAQYNLAGAVFGATTDIISPSVLFNGALRHLAAVRSGNNIYVYLNGIRGPTVLTSVTGAIFSSSAKVIIGARQSAGSSFQFPMAGRFDEFRFTPGVARYTGVKFSPVPRPFARS